jgi:transposase
VLNADDQPNKTLSPAPTPETLPGAASPASPQDLEVQGLRAEVKYLRAQIQVLQRMLYGPRSEKIDPNQLQMLLDGLSAQDSTKPETPTPPPPTAATAAQSSKPRRHPGRKPLPADLPRKEIILEPPAEEMVAPGPDWQRVKIGQEVTEELDCEPARFWVNLYIRPKYKWEPPRGTPQLDEPPIFIAELPFRAIEKGRPGYGLLSLILVNKFADHLPLYRQRQIFLRRNIALPLPTLCGWVGQAAGLLYPVYLEQKRFLFESGSIQGDETPVPQQDPTLKGRNRQAYLYAYCLPWAEVVYDYRLGRGREGPLEFLKGFQGKLQTDGYDGYNAAEKAYGLVRLGCWVHCRRYFEHALKTAPQPAAQVLEILQRFYALEHQCKEAKLGPAERLAVRREKSAPIIQEFWTLVETLLPSTLPKEPLGEAVRYARGQRVELDRCLEHGDVEVDNNSCEHTMRGPVIGRKNWLHLGSQEAGTRAAVCYSLIETCKRLKIDPFAYLRDVLEKVSVWPDKKIRQLLPRFWKENQNPVPTP